MDFLYGNQSQKYESILDEINSEFERSEQLKREINNENDKIVAIKLVNAKNIRISHLSVKVFNSVHELQNLYVDDLKSFDFCSLNKSYSSKFYLLEFYIPKIVLEKFLRSNWKLQICAAADNFNTCKISSLISNEASKFYDIIPVRADLREVTITTCLFLPSDQNCNIIELNKLDVDISYHFESDKEVKNKYKHLSESLKKIPKLYNTFDSASKVELQTQVACNFDNKAFIKVLVKNSYHRLSLEQFSELENSEKNEWEIKCYVFNNRVILSYDKEKKILKICTNSPNDLVFLKKFFTQFGSFDRSNIKTKLAQFIEMEKIVDEDDSIPKLVQLHEAARNVWF